MARIAIDARKLGDFGIGTHLEVLLHGLAQQEAQHEYLVFVDASKDYSVPPGPFRAIPCRAGQYGLLEHLELPWMARKHGAQLLHTPHYVLPLTRRAPSVATIHDLIHLRFPEYLPNTAARYYARAMLRSAWRRASLVIVVSEFTRADCVLEFGERDGVVVVPNGVSPVFFDKAGEDRDELLLQQLGLQPADRRRPFVLMPGNIKAHKNHEGLLRAFALLIRECDVDLVLTGNGEAQYAGLRAQAAELGVLQRVHCLGWLTQVQLRACYRKCAVLAFPSLYEGFGLPVAEAIVSGAAIVSSNNSSLPEVCGDAALLVEPRDDREFAQALARVISEPAVSEDLRRRARLAANRFQPDRQSLATLAVYERALSC